MVQRLKEVDVVVIGVGMVGSIIAKELAAAGYKVVGLERGQPRFTVPDFQSPAGHDERPSCESRSPCVRHRCCNADGAL